VAYIPFFFQHWVGGNGFVMVVGADVPMIRVATRDEAAGEGMAFGVRVVTLGRGMATTMAIGTPMSELGIRESILDSPAFFIL
jgi:hypothetical protein